MFAITFRYIALLDELLLWMKCGQLWPKARGAVGN